MTKILYKCEKCDHQVELHLTTKPIVNVTVDSLVPKVIPKVIKDSPEVLKGLEAKPKKIKRAKRIKSENRKESDEIDIRPKRIAKDPTRDRKRNSDNKIVPQSSMILQNLKNSDPTSYNLIMIQPDLPVCVELKHRGFWITNDKGEHEPTSDETCDRNSVMFTNDCLLYVYKLALRHLLLSMQVVGPSDIDPANLIPHTVVRKNKTDPFSKFNKIQNEKFIITEEMFSAKSDFLIVELDAKRDLHSTLIYLKKIKDKVNLLEAIKTVIKVLNAYPHLIKEYSNLPYFGFSNAEYWYENPNSYPFNIAIPENYKPKPKISIKIDPKNISEAGSIIATK